MTIELVHVGDVLALHRRGVIVEPNRMYEEIGIRSFGRGIFHKEAVSGADLGAKRVFRIEPGDLVISNVFAWEGAIALASEAEAGKVGSHRFMTFAPTNGRIDAGWAAWFLRSEVGLERIGQASPGSAGRNRTLAIERFEALEIPLPPIEEQRRVAARLARLRASADELSAWSDHASELSNALCVSATSRPDLPEPGKRLADWRRVMLGDLLVPSTKQTQVNPMENYRIAGIYSFGRGLIDRGEIEGSETSYRVLTVLEEGDIVVSKLNGWEGAVAVVDTHFDGHCVSSEYPTFTVNTDLLLPDFFKGIARSRWFWEALNTGARGSMVRRRRVSSIDFLATEIWLPPIAAQTMTASWVEQIDRASRCRLTAQTRLRALVPAALNQAFADRN